MLVDLRSDTLTRPSASMRRAMAEAEVGDDVYGEDPTVHALEERAASLLGTEAALFVASGTMGNQIALRLHTRPGTEVLAGARAHIVRYEAGAAAANAGVQVHGLADDDGTFDPAAVLELSGAGYHGPPVSLVAVEDTHLPSGGRPWPLEQLAAVRAAAAERGLPVHIDGARLWNAAVALGCDPADIAQHADTVSCCLSKGLGAPVGSVLGLPGRLYGPARLERQRFGGAWRQAGVLAAAGLVALDGIDRLADDHARARALAEAVSRRWPGSCAPSDVQTNIVLFRPQGPTAAVLAHLDAAGVRASLFGPGEIRLVTHLDVDDAGVAHACEAIASAP